MTTFWCLLATITLLASFLMASDDQGRHEVVCLSDSSSLNTSCHESCITTSFEDILGMSAILEFNIIICSSVVHLSKVITFENKANISFVTAEQSATISCHNESAGIVFMNVDTVSISGVHLIGCSVRQNGSVSFAASIVITHCNSVKVSDFEVRNSIGVGLALINMCKSVEVKESLFTSCENGGLYIDYPEHQDRNCSTTIHISYSNFSDNKVSNTGNKLSNGGGLKAFFQDLNHSVSTVIVECAFENNVASWSTDAVESFSGGAVYLNFSDNSFSEVFVHINNSRFCNNLAKLHGGAVAVSYHGQHYKNLVIVSECRLISNRASNGGGTSLEFSQDARSKEVSVMFVSCKWIENVGETGAAVDVVPSYQGDSRLCGCFNGPVFENCTFIENQAEEYKEYHQNYVIHKLHKGVLFSRDIDIQLQGIIQFENSRGSAMYLLSSDVYFQKKSHVDFIENQGYRGGAIAMYGTSALNVYNNVSILFKDNSASYLGGAIYHDQSYRLNTRCFLQYRGNDDIENRHIYIIFQNNTVSGDSNGQSNKSYDDSNGHSIYLSISSSCLINKKSIHDSLKSVATLKFSGSDEKKEISILEVKHFTTSEDSLPKYIIPGQVTDIDIVVNDDINVTKVSYLFKISVTQSKNISIDDAYVYTSNSKIRLKGMPNSSGELKVSLPDIDDYFITMNVTLQECPPGFVHSKGICICSVQTYPGISHCNMNTFQANLFHGFWAGYTTENDKGYGTPANFYTANCPKGYCKCPQRNGALEITLPSNTNSTELSTKVCRENRRGIMCGNCVEGSSVLYHSYDYICFPDRKLCTVGWLFYILSELVPLTIFFTVVLCFDISFTSGYVSAFVFYAQMFETLLVGANKFIYFEKPVDILLDALKFIVRMFNLSFFAVEKLSFCLWKGANTLDMIAFNYVTIIYSFVLVIITVVLANRFSIKMNQIFGVNKSHLSNSIIHGLSSFLVLCYFQSTKVSLLLLTPTKLKREKAFSRVFYHGEWKYFQQEHIPYAIPAVFFFIFITLIPPFLLLCYPLCYKVLALCKLEESKFTKVLCKVIPLEKYKPFFDSFQGTFKDEHRYFAGLFFMYRFIILLTFAVTDTLKKYYTVTELLFILMLLLHAFLSPHKKRYINNLHIAIFFLLAVFNGLTIFNFLSHASFDNSVLVSVTTSVQALLAWIPVVSMFILIVIKICAKLKSRASSVGEVTDTMTLFLLEDSGSDSALSSSYSRDN